MWPLLAAQPFGETAYFQTILPYLISDCVEQTDKQYVHSLRMDSEQPVANGAMQRAPRWTKMSSSSQKWLFKSATAI